MSIEECFEFIGILSDPVKYIKKLVNENIQHTLKFNENILPEEKLNKLEKEMKQGIILCLNISLGHFQSSGTFMLNPYGFDDFNNASLSDLDKKYSANIYIPYKYISRAVNQVVQQKKTKELSAYIYELFEEIKS